MNGKLTAPKAIFHPTPKDIIWFAGVYEGEGSCSCSKNHRSISICVAQKDPWLLDRFADYFGGTIGSLRKDNCRNWQISGPRAAGFLMTIYQFLSPRRQTQVRAALDAWMSPLPIEQSRALFDDSELINDV